MPKFLTDKEAELLQQMVDKVRGLRGNSPSRHQVVDVNPAPDVYIARAPAGGITAYSARDGLGTGSSVASVNSAECEIYAINFQLTGAYHVEPMRFTHTVYNLGLSAISGGAIFITVRDKLGSWITIEPATGTWGRIEGEGSISDSLDGKYAWIEMEDTTVGGTFTVKTNGIVGHVKNVNGQTSNSSYAQDDAGKRAVPVGLIVWMKAGTPYLDSETNTIFSNWRFTTTDLLHVIKLKLTGERNAYGHYGATVCRWDSVEKKFVDSEVIWTILLTG